MNLVYRISDHGISMNTFLTKCKGEDITLIIMEDKDGYKFGGGQTIAKHGSALTRMKCTNSAIALA